MKTIKSIGVVGAGTMGSALAQKFAQEGFKVILVDREMSYVEKGLSGVENTLREGIERRLFTEEQVGNILANIKGTDQLRDLQVCDLVVEAIYEDLDAKSDLFKQLSVILPKETVVATNTSSFSVTELADSVSHPERFIGLHYFYHAAKNRLVEIIPGEKTSPETLRSAEIFSSLSGKDPVICKDRYGFAVNRFFVPWLNEAVRLLEEGVADPATIDAVCMKTFKIGMGPFALMNATGVPIAYHAQKTLEAFGDFYKVSGLLKQQALANEPWQIEDAAGDTIDEQTEKLIKERMSGTVFLVCSQILDEGVCPAADLNRGARIGLRWRKGPVELMKSYGEKEVKRLIRQMAEKYQIALPQSAAPMFWEMEFVQLQKHNNIAVITIVRPEDLNALNEEVITQLSEKFAEANDDPAIDFIFISGSGKAFVAGADIKFFVDNIKKNTISNIVDFTKFGQSVFEKIDQCSKTVVSIINGLALGGGLELALCADVILAVPNALMAFPETGIGIYPGLGGTQRTQTRIGKGLTKYLIYTGQMLNAKAAEQIGLVDAVIQREDIFELKEGKKPIPSPKEPGKISDIKWKAVEDFFNKNSIARIMKGDYTESQLPREEIDKLRKKIQHKAPIALKIAENLINEAGGISAELEEISKVFSTEDALLGLSSIGKRVEFKGK
jgi:enoyl-CoA hydratase/3-hydroxyacyl-CoA dehydrogenase